MAKKKSASRTALDPEQAELYILEDLEQVKVLADPLRVRLLESFCSGVRTTKQVAELLGERPTRLYHHVEALERVGLIRLAETRQNRGTVEKYYTGVARTFRADPSLFSSAVERGDEAPLLEVVSTIMGNTTEDLRRVIRAGHDVFTGSEEGVLSYTELHGSEETVADFREKLLALLQELADKCCGDRDADTEGGRRYRLTLAYFPLDLTDDAARPAGKGRPRRKTTANADRGGSTRSSGRGRPGRRRGAGNRGP